MKRALILSGGGARGAFQAGVWRYLGERGWDPDIICGTSVGAVNAAGIGCGLSPEQLSDLWVSFHRRRIFRFTLRRFLPAMLGGRQYKPLADTGPLRTLLEDHVNIDVLRKSRRQIIIAAVNMHRSRIRYFDQREITVRHVMASSAIPLMFPWQFIDGEPYWDGATLENTPIRAALDQGAEFIITVLLSPVGVYQQSIPRTPMRAAELALEQFLVGSYQSVVQNRLGKNIRMAVVAPERMLGLRSYLNFTPGQAKALMRLGYESARRQLGRLTP